MPTAWKDCAWFAVGCVNVDVQQWPLSLASCTVTGVCSASAGTPASGPRPRSTIEVRPAIVNGETGPAEVYAVDPSDGLVLGTLVTAFGNDHVAGGAWHPTRGALFLVADKFDSSPSTIAEIDPAAGAAPAGERGNGGTGGRVRGNVG